jgi:ElaB/YqjD/DUF883 family membrane-anchored ribosome-binding protein
MATTTTRDDLTGIRETATSEVKGALSDAQSLLQQAAAVGGEQARELQQRAAEALRTGQQKLREIQSAVTQNTRAAAQATDSWVHTNPWSAIGVAAGVGFLIGMLVSRR